ncbi:Mucin-2 [Streptomyces sp. NPDC008121]|uniref:Mucin-2 n=1 Tax=Streptomyces sp. NPDC008121 TaxID=3364809 RepID=UPI0036E6EA9A
MVGFHSSALDGVAANPALPTPLLLRLLAFDGGGEGPPFQALYRPGLPDAAVAAIVAHPLAGVRIDFARSAQAEPGQRARLVDDPDPEVRAALAWGPDRNHDPRRPVRPLPDPVCGRLLADPEPAVRERLLRSRHLAPRFLASLARHPDPAARRAALRVPEALAADERAGLLDDPDPGVRRAAALCACPGDARLTSALLRDPAARPEALRRGLLRRADAERFLAEDVHPADLARNPFLPADLVDRLAVHPDESVRRAVSLRPELTEARRAAIDRTAGPLVGADDDVDWVAAGIADQEVLRRAATSSHPLLRRAAARSPHLPSDLLRLLAADEDVIVLTHLAVHHPDTPERVLMRVYARLGGTFSAWMATGHPRFPREGLAARFADHPEGRYRQLAVRDPEAGPGLIERLSHDPDVRTRQAAAADPRLPLPRLLAVLALPETACGAGANPALPEREMARVMDGAGVPR